MKFLFTLSLLIATSTGSLHAQETNVCAKFNQAVKSTYNFKPSKLGASARDVKSSAMDRFWEMVKADQKRFLPCLRTALQDTKSDKWFLFDASSLLVEIDPTQDSKAIQVRNFIGVDLNDVDLRTWVEVLAQRGFEGFDVSEAGARWLALPSAKYYLPEHAFEVGKLEGALFLFGSMDEAQATPALLKIVSQPNQPEREIALAILMTQATPESLRALKELDTNTFSEKTRIAIKNLLTSPPVFKPRAEPKTSRAEFVQAFEEMLRGNPTRFMNLVSTVPDGEKDVVAVLKPEDLPLVRKVRRLWISRGNQHAIEYFQSFTAILLTLTANPDAVK